MLYQVRMDVILPHGLFVAQPDDLKAYRPSCFRKKARKHMEAALLCRRPIRQLQHPRRGIERRRAHAAVGPAVRPAHEDPRHTASKESVGSMNAAPLI
jgi:hypothetical protein